jgi:hypothetical protein
MIVTTYQLVIGPACFMKRIYTTEGRQFVFFQSIVFFLNFLRFDEINFAWYIFHHLTYRTSPQMIGDDGCEEVGGMRIALGK